MGITADADINKIEGGTDGTPIGNDGDKLKVASNISVASPGSPTYSSKYRSIFDGTGLTLTTSYQTVYTYSGTGKFVGFVLDFTAGNNVAGVKLTIDSDVIFELNADDVLDVQLGTGNTISGTFGGPVFDNTDKKFSFEPPFPILFTSSMTIEAKRVTGTPDLSRYIVNHTKET